MADAAPTLTEDGTGETSPGPPGVFPVSLPAFVQRLPDGLHLNLLALESPDFFRGFVDRTFCAGMYFTALDYPVLHKLLYSLESPDIPALARDMQKAGRPPLLRFAAGIASLAPEKSARYRSPKLLEGGLAAEYLFEPVMVEKTVEEPLYGEPGPDGIRAIIDQTRRSVTVRERLDLDEFIAVMWVAGIRYGIDGDAVSKAIASDRAERVAIARMLSPMPGRDATVVELSRSLHRDDTPRMLPDGRIDLHQFQNRFPQVARDTRLLCKVARVPGRNGWDLAGNALSPDVPRDIDMAQMAGPGTRVDRTSEGEFVVADMSGFLQIDAASGTVSISEKIVHREGVGLHTTGNLTLDGDDYEEHGEVEELSRIEGKNMTFMNNVFGNIVSHGGCVVFRKNLNGGSVRNPGGTVAVEGHTSRATLEAVGGDITLDHAEGCVIVGKNVRIAHAVQCDVFAEELSVEVAEGCALAAQRAHVGTATSRRDSETLISMLVPDLSAYARQLEELARRQSEHESAIEAGTRQIEALTSQPDVKSYSILNARMRNNELQLTTEQSANWQKLLSRVLPVLRHLKTLNDELQAVRGASHEIALKMERLQQECQAMSTSIACHVGSISGDTIVRAMEVRLDAPPLHTLAPRELRVRLRASGTGCSVLYSGSEGTFEWQPDANGTVET